LIEATNADTLNQKIQAVMQQLTSRFYLNKLIINNEKTNAISLHAWQNKCNLKPEIVYQNLEIKYKNETKFLGLHLTGDVTGDVHIKHVCNMLTSCTIIKQAPIFQMKTKKKLLI
jgi:methanogenic corrinoid protein MtbC1